MLPCGQCTPTTLTISSDAPSSHASPHQHTHTQHTSPKSHRQQTQHTPVKNTNQPTQPHFSGEEQCVPKSADGSQVKCSKQQPRQQNGHLCFYCNQAGHIRRDCREIPYCSRCRMKGHPSDQCKSKPQRSQSTRQPGESREPPQRSDNLPQFLNQRNLCLHYAGNHQTATCMMTRQQQGTSMGRNITIPQNSPNTTQPSSSSPHSQISCPQSQSTVHVQMPTININVPPFPTNLHQAPPPPPAQNHSNPNYHTNQQHIRTPPTQPLNARIPQPFNPHVLRHTFLNIHLLTVHQHKVLTHQSYWLYKSNGNDKKDWTWNVMQWKNKRKKGKE